MKLYFDIGNTNIKINIVTSNDSKYLLLPTNKPYKSHSIYTKISKITSQYQVEKVFVCSVVPRLTPIIEELAQKYYQVQAFVMGNKTKVAISLNVDTPNRIGHDLLMLASYAHSRYRNVIIINLGTTTTITHVLNGVLEGVIIMPGIRLQLDAVTKQTAQINDIVIGFQPVAIGKNTTQALGIGIINSHISAIKNHIEAIAPAAQVIISGGNASFIRMQLPYEYVKEATIEGIKTVEKQYEK